MTTEKKILWTVGVVASVVLLSFALWPSAKERLAPELVTAHVALMPDGGEVAVVDEPVALEAGTGFTLYAVLEAEDRDGKPVYYTEAPALSIGGERVPAEALRIWDRQRVAKVFWFSVEGPAPFVKLEDAGDFDGLRFTEFFRPEWPSAWTVAGRLDPKFSDSLVRDSVEEVDRSFGTQRFQVRIELFSDEDSLTAEERYVSKGADALPEAVERFPAVFSALPGPAGPASLAFGLTQIEPPDDLARGEGRPLLAELTELARARLAFTRTSVIVQVKEAAGRRGERLDWTTIDLEDGPPWQGAGEGGDPQAVAPGDLVRAGARVVVLFRDHDDQGTSGRLDREDLCFDYERGAAVRPLGEVFTGGGLVELARL